MRLYCVRCLWCACCDTRCIQSMMYMCVCCENAWFHAALLRALFGSPNNARCAGCVTKMCVYSVSYTMVHMRSITYTIMCLSASAYTILCMHSITYTMVCTRFITYTRMRMRSVTYTMVCVYSIAYNNDVYACHHLHDGV